MRSSESEFTDTMTPRSRHQRHVVRNRVPRFDLVRPHVGERRRHRAVLRDLVGDLVALEHVLEGVDLEPELVGDADQHEDLVGAIAVRVHLEIAVQNVDERFEPQVAPRRDRVRDSSSPPRGSPSTPCRTPSPS